MNHKKTAFGYLCSVNIVLALTLIGMGQASTIPESDIKPEHIYSKACAGCHGLDGRGLPRELVGFETPLPDFTDCSFVTREPDADWIAITSEGGPVRAFDRMMPSFQEAMSEEQIQAALDHIRDFCEEDCWPRGDLNFPRALLTEKAYPEDEFVYSMSASTQKEVSIANKLIYEQRFLAQSQFEVIVPFAIIEGNDGKGQMGLGDVAIGAKTVLFSLPQAGSILSLAAEVILPTGDADRGFGKELTIFEPFLAFGQALPFDSFIQVQVGAEIPDHQGKANNELFWRAALGITFEQGDHSRAWTPMVEFVGVNEFADDEVETKFDIAPGIQITLNQRQNIMLALGVQIPVTEFSARDPVVLAYFLWDWFDGSLTEGW